MALLLDTWTSPDGAAVRVRPLTAGDFELEFEFVRGLSPVTGYQRLLSGRRLSRAEIERFSNVDGECEVALIATIEQEGRERQVGVARFVREDCGDAAEFALVIADAWQRRGLGRRLLELLVGEARSRGLRRLHGETLSDNAAMIGLARGLGFKIARSPASATITNVTALLQAL
jgi:acetyltransferase